MKKERYFRFAVLLLTVALLSTGCGPRGTEVSPIDQFYTVTDHGNATYSYIVTDKSGKVIYTEENLTKLPHTQQLSENVFCLTFQSGTGLATNRALYFDVENSLISTFYYVLGAKNGYVVYADYMNEEHFIVVRDMFDEEGYFCKYKLKNVSPAMDFATACHFDDAGNATITYLTGEDFTETQLQIAMP